MAHQQAAAAVAAYSFNGHGLRFLNEDWNDSISNGSPFTLTWNQSLIKAGAELGLFKVTYPANGVVVYDLVANLTDTMNSTSCVWTPEALKNELYAVWLTNGQQVHPNWTFSPPWIPKEKDASRNDSVDSAITVQTIIESKVGTKSKPSLWIITRPHEEQDVFITDLWEDEDTAVEPVSRGQGLAVQSPV
ncbi:hypothetical protein ED733_001650 [Metarhizium rileyi]|uniref:Uncharacterized protein n=1 Tax=Metarhizium rileyi (strain RCEF 4871) TaxID=1649241 RepID=A0A5C6G0G7_METRR|nr:hypothetical protein ED733_001650 [Metarhizium rileyi]